MLWRVLVFDGTARAHAVSASGAARGITCQDGLRVPLNSMIAHRFGCDSCLANGDLALDCQVPDGTMVSVTLITKYHDDRGAPVRHWHTLEVKEGGAASRPLSMGLVQFPNLVVTRAAMPADLDDAGAARNPEDQHVIRLMFTMMFRDSAGVIFKTSVISNPIYGIELKIHKSSHPRVPVCCPEYRSASSDRLNNGLTSPTRQVAGQLDVFFLTSKVKKKNTLIKVREVYPAPFDPGPNSGWELDERGRLTFTVDNLHVHYQVALPPSHAPSLVRRRA